MTFKKGQSGNPAGAKKGPRLPTIILKDAYLLAAQAAGGGGKDGLVNYLTKVAIERPQVFVPGLARIIPMEISMKGNGTIRIEIVKRFDGEDAKVIEHKPNGSLNGNGHDPETAK